MKEVTVTGKLVDIRKRSIYSAEIKVVDGVIASITPMGEDDIDDGYLLPGFIDAHIHIESSMLVPTEFALIALKHGTVATVSDPHEIANVLGVSGVEYMVRNAAQSPLKFTFGAPSCVPATNFETAGAQISAEDIAYMFDELGLTYLSEMMNYPGVIYDDPDVMRKIAVARERNVPIDGHAPGLRGEGLLKYASAGITTDHECFTYEEAKEKLDIGMKVIIREGSAAKNYPALHPLIADYASSLMFCSDDKHPDDLLLGHINSLVARAVQDGYDLYDVLQMACINPVEHYRLPVGGLKVGDPADFIRVYDLESFKVKDSWIDGQQVVSNEEVLVSKVEIDVVNQFNANRLEPFDLHVKDIGSPIRVIKAIDGELITESFTYHLKGDGDKLVSDISADVLKMVVHNRYEPAKPAVAFIHGFGFTSGAIASSVAHDCHNIVAVGTDDASILSAVNAIIDTKGGICVNDGHKNHIMPLPIAGIISELSAVEAAELYSNLDRKTKELGSTLRSPFMTLSFMALLVIPKLKLSDLGLFDGGSFQFVDLYEKG